MKIFSPGFKNAVKIFLVCVLFIVFVSTLGYLLDKILFWPTLFLSCVMVLLAVFFSTKIILSFLKAEVSTDPKLSEIIGKMAGEVPSLRPKIYFVPDSTPKLYSVGQSICLTKAALQILNKQELQVLVARQLIRIHNLDTKLHDIVTILSGPLSFLVLAVIISPTLESSLDFEAAQIIGDPGSLANALEKMSPSQEISERVKLLRSA